MPYDDPDPTDPMTLHGVVFEAARDAVEEMARCFIEEFARLGLDSACILRLFENPGYIGPHGALAALGSEAIRQMVEKELAMRAHFPQRTSAQVQQSAAGPVHLPVLEAGCW